MIIDAHMHVIGAPNWLPSTGLGFDALAKTWAREVRWFDDIEAGVQRFVRSVEKCWDPSGEKAIARMDEAGVDASMMMPMDLGLAVNDEGVIPIEEKNRLCAELTQKHRGRLYSFCGVDPRRPQALELLKRGLTEWGMKGLKLYPTAGFYPDDPIVYPLYRLCAEHGVPVLLHQGHSQGRFKSKYGHPMYVDSVAGRFPRAEAHPRSRRPYRDLGP